LAFPISIIIREAREIYFTNVEKHSKGPVSFSSFSGEARYDFRMPERDQKFEQICTLQYTGDASKGRRLGRPGGTAAHVVFIPDRSPKQAGHTLSLRWEHEKFRWSVYQQGTREVLGRFLEEWLPRCPDPALMEKALERLNEQIPAKAVLGAYRAMHARR
jgi:hypothetical protein